VDLPDPRERQDPAVQALRARLMATFQDAANFKPRASDAEAGNESASKTESLSNIH
jgi:NitT/TauT family transport system ATP-binding protein